MLRLTLSHKFLHGSHGGGRKTKMKTGPKPDVGPLPSVMWDIWNENKEKKAKSCKF